MTPLAIHALYLDQASLLRLQNNHIDKLTVVVLKTVLSTTDMCKSLYRADHPEQPQAANEIGDDELDLDLLGHRPVDDVYGNTTLILPRYLNRPDHPLIANDDDYNEFLEGFDTALQVYAGENEFLLAEASAIYQSHDRSIATPVVVIISDYEPHALEIPLPNMPEFDPHYGPHIIELLSAVGKDIGDYFEVPPYLHLVDK